jgi:hypothetical protein
MPAMSTDIPQVLDTKESRDLMNIRGIICRAHLRVCRDALQLRLFAGKSEAIGIAAN